MPDAEPFALRWAMPDSRPLRCSPPPPAAEEADQHRAEVGQHAGRDEHAGHVGRHPAWVRDDLQHGADLLGRFDQKSAW